MCIMVLSSVATCRAKQIATLERILRPLGGVCGYAMHNETLDKSNGMEEENR
jgi:hypothetical protein